MSTATIRGKCIQGASSQHKILPITHCQVRLRRPAHSFNIVLYLVITMSFYSLLTHSNCNYFLLIFDTFVSLTFVFHSRFTIMANLTGPDINVVRVIHGGGSSLKQWEKSAAFALEEENNFLFSFI